MITQISSTSQSLIFSSYEELSGIIYASFEFHFVQLASAKRFFSFLAPPHRSLIHSVAFSSAVDGTQSKTGQFIFRRGQGSRRVQVKAHIERRAQEHAWYDLCRTLSTLSSLRKLDVWIFKPEVFKDHLPNAKLLHALSSIRQVEHFTVHLPFWTYCYSTDFRYERTEIFEPFELHRYVAIAEQPHMGGGRMYKHNPFPPCFTYCCRLCACPYFAYKLFVELAKLPYELAVHNGLL